MPEDRQFVMGDTEMRATPPKFPIALKASEVVSGIHDFVSKPFGFDNPPGRMLGDFMGLPDVAKTLEHVGYGERLTTGQGWNLHVGDETLGAIGALPFGMPGKAARTGAKFAEKTATEALNPEIKLLHSSPHKFDEFDSGSHMGKGEGAQVYGQGSYLTDSPGVHKYYNRAMAARVGDPADQFTGVVHNGNFWRFDDFNRSLGKGLLDTTPQERAMLVLHYEKDKGKTLESLQRHYEEEADDVKRIRNAIQEIQQSGGKLHSIGGHDVKTLQESLDYHKKYEKVWSDAAAWMKVNKNHIDWVDLQGDVVYKGKIYQPDLGGSLDGVMSPVHNRVLNDLHSIRDGSDPIRNLKGMLDNDERAALDDIKSFAEKARAQYGYQYGDTRPMSDLEHQIEDSLQYKRQTLERVQEEKAWLDEHAHEIKVDKSKLPPMTKAQRYEVEFPDKHVDKLLQYDKPYSEQTPYVQKRLQKVLDKDHETLLKSNQTGSGLYERAAGAVKVGDVINTGDIEGVKQTFTITKISGNRVTFTRSNDGVSLTVPRSYFFNMGEWENTDLRSSAVLTRAGIPGHKYSAAGQSRSNRSDKHHNYVIYPEADKKHLKITKREDVGND